MKVQTEQSKFDTDEHILVCLSSSPSNARIIHTAAKMAKVLHARFTAIYVQTDTVINDEDQSRLSQNIQLAQRLGAEIVMTHGENVALQISEYVRLSDVTKIVIGQSSARRRGLFGRPTLTEKLISSAPNVDIHIIPDALNYTKSHRRRLFFGAEIPSLRDIAVTVLALAVCTAIGFLFDHLDFPDTNIVTVYILGVLMISVLTKGYLCSIAGSLLSVVLFGFFLTEPRLSFQTYAVGYPVTFAVMLASSVLTGTLASKLKDHARLSARSAFRVQVLFDTDRLLQKAKNNDDVLSVTCMQLSRLLDRSIVAYTKGENGMLSGRLYAEKKDTHAEKLLSDAERQTAEWVLQNGHRAGAATAQFGKSECLYLAIRRGRVGLKDPKKPIGSFIFLGPTGVGKTELCKALAAAMFGDENAMIRLDMSEYMEKHTVSRFIGSPPGYVGYDEGGQLTEKVRRKPYSVVLFDEIEKAHPDVFNMLLQILDDGVLTDGQGRRVDFKNCIIIMTSNVGAKLISQKQKAFGFAAGAKELEQNEKEIKDAVMGELRNTFRPEFLNRVDDIIVFQRLTKENIKEIASRLLAVLQKRVEDMGIEVTFSDEAVSKIADAGFDDVYGARPLKRAIQSRIEDALSEEMLKGNVKKGGKYICNVKDDKFVFDKAEEKTVTE